MSGHEPEDPHSLADYDGSFLGEVDRGVNGLRVGWSPDLGYAAVEPEVLAICEEAAKTFADLGCTVDEVPPPGFPNPTTDQTFIILAATSDAVWLRELTPGQLEQIGPEAKFFLEAGNAVRGVDYVQANLRRMAIWRAMRRFHETYDLLLTPSLSVTAFPVGKMPARIGDVDLPPFGWSPFTQPFNLTGQPTASVPCGFDGRGLPVGLHIVGRAFQDSLVLRAARAFEEAHPWAHLRPPLQAAVASDPR
jgi:aspartyl-tRNA(Asn)/glutamyl-tRNA(Gln) amidotransferase subunit A